MRARNSSGSILVAHDEFGHAVDHLKGLALRRVEAGAGHPGDDLLRAEAEAVSVDGHVLQAPEGAEGRAIQAVVHHEVVHKQPATGLQRLHGVGVEAADDGLRHGAGDVRHQHDIIGGIRHGPVRAAGIELREGDTLADVLGLLRADALAGAADLRQLQDGGLQAWCRPDKHVGEGTGAAANVQHGGDVAELELLLDQVLGRGHRAVVLRLRVGLGHLRVREPARVAGGLARGHDVGELAHAVVELPANLVAQVVAVVVARGGNHVLRGAGRERVESLAASLQALDRRQRGHERLEPGRLHAAGLPDGSHVEASIACCCDVVEDAELQSSKERLGGHEAVGHGVEVYILALL
mmetsp:Transcript_1351/g.3903  ORF Transcript_1351/g.3903 Transcript_1351/m.3903 type:complete len:352 (-) Transcript_1351:228-1283(-)